MYKPQNWLTFQKSIASLLCVAVLTTALSPNAYAAVKRNNAFDYVNIGETFKSFMTVGGYDNSRIENPPNPVQGQNWQAKFGGEIVSWQNENQMQFYYDNMTTTMQHTWATSGGALGGGSLGMPTGSGSNIVEMARSQLGVQEIPANSNCVSYVKWYNNWSDSVSPSSYADWHWCCIFVVWAASQFGYVDRNASDIFAWTASCTTQFDYMVNTKGYAWTRVSNVWNNPNETVLPGDIMFFCESGSFSGTKGHVGIVQEVGPSNTYIITVEGNTGGRFSPDGHGTPNGGVSRQYYTKRTQYTAMQNGFIVRPAYPA